MPTQEQLDRLDIVTPPAIRASDTDEALARVKLAQWINESGWGASSVLIRDAQTGTITGYNPFGIKAARNEPGKEYPTREELTLSQIENVKKRGVKILSIGTRKPNGKYDVQIIDRFRTWPTIEAAFRGHTEFLQTGYRKAAWDRYIAARRPKDSPLWTAPGEIARDVSTLAYELQHLVFNERTGVWLRYAEDDEYENKISKTARSSTISVAIATCRLKEQDPE